MIALALLFWAFCAPVFLLGWATVGIVVWTSTQPYATDPAKWQVTAWFGLGTLLLALAVVPLL